MTPEAIANLIRQMTLEEKISLLHGELGDAYGANQAGHVPGVPRLGIPEVFIADGEYGVDITWDATAFPAKVSLAATFSEAVALDYGRALGLEARDAGMHMILSTRVNIARDPVAQIGQSNGGNFQTLGEDPLLNARLGIDGSDVGLEYLATGELDATAARDVSIETQFTLDTCERILAGETVEKTLRPNAITLLTKEDYAE